ncbi:MAG: hypothetical protein ABSA40_03385 [Candidatus Dormibacteria bacterium]
MSRRTTLPTLLAGSLAAALLAACGSSSTTPSSGSSAPGGGTATPASTAPTPTPATNSAIATGSCPSASTVGSALGTTLPAPTVVTPAAGATPVPSGESGIACSYISESATPVVVIVALASGVPSGFITQEEQKQLTSLQGIGVTVSFAPLSGVGDEAATYQYSAAGLTVEGVVAGQGSNFVGIFTEGTPATLAQIENLVKQLL